MIAFIVGVLVGAVGVFLVLDNKPKLAAKLATVKEIVEEKIKEKIAESKE